VLEACLLGVVANACAQCTMCKEYVSVRINLVFVRGTRQARMQLRAYCHLLSTCLALVKCTRWVHTCIDAGEEACWARSNERIAAGRTSDAPTTTHFIVTSCLFEQLHSISFKYIHPESNRYGGLMPPLPDRRLYDGEACRSGRKRGGRARS